MKMAFRKLLRAHVNDRLRPGNATRMNNAAKQLVTAINYDIYDEKITKRLANLERLRASNRAKFEQYRELYTKLRQFVNRGATNANIIRGLQVLSKLEQLKLNYKSAMNQRNAAHRTFLAYGLTENQKKARRFEDQAVRLKEKLDQLEAVEKANKNARKAAGKQKKSPRASKNAAAKGNVNYAGKIAAATNVRTLERNIDQAIRGNTSLDQAEQTRLLALLSKRKEQLHAKQTYIQKIEGIKNKANVTKLMGEVGSDGRLTNANKANLRGQLAARNAQFITTTNAVVQRKKEFMEKVAKATSRQELTNIISNLPANTILKPKPNKENITRAALIAMRKFPSEARFNATRNKLRQSVTNAKTIEELTAIIDSLNSFKNLRPANKTGIQADAEKARTERIRKGKMRANANANSVRAALKAQYKQSFETAPSTETLRAVHKKMLNNKSLSEGNKNNLQRISDEMYAKIQAKRTSNRDEFTRRINAAKSNANLNAIQRNLRTAVILKEDQIAKLTHKIANARLRLSTAAAEARAASKAANNAERAKTNAAKRSLSTAAAEARALAASKAANNAERAKTNAARRKALSNHAANEQRLKNLREAMDQTAKRKEAARLAEVRREQEAVAAAKRESNRNKRNKEAVAAAKRASNRVAQNKRNKEAAAPSNNSKLRKLKQYLTQKQKTNVNFYISRIRQAGKKPLHNYNANSDLASGTTSRPTLAQFIVRYYRSQVEHLYGANR
jgi:hypothetical protein